MQGGGRNDWQAEGVARLGVIDRLYGEIVFVRYGWLYSESVDLFRRGTFRVVV